MKDQDNGRFSSLALGYMWSVRITMIGLEMALPVVGGVWVDIYWKTLPFGTILGLFLGIYIMFCSLMKIVKDAAKHEKEKAKEPEVTHNSES